MIPSLYDLFIMKVMQAPLRVAFSSGTFTIQMIEMLAKEKI
jgi:hypothetical protein